jgi:glycosyltransferase involved in cell wall biosynthesis
VKVAIYNEPHGGGGTVGGSEYTVAVLAAAISKFHKVDLFHHRQGLTKDEFTRTFEINLDNVNLRYVEHDPDVYSNNLWKRYQCTRASDAKISKNYDCFIASTHNVPPFCHAKFGVLYVYFPFFDRFTTWPWMKDESDSRSFRGSLRHRYYDWEWHQRLAGYHVKAAISAFTREWTSRRWGVDCAVLHPPVSNRFNTRQKKNMILSVGRFTAGKISKRQLEMMTTYGQMRCENGGGWNYVSAGIVSDTSVDDEYLESVRSLAKEYGGCVLVNISRQELKDVYESAKVFWHATGLNEDEELNPERQEHFGISTVEAMAAGCVPVVINRGGQREIVEHGISGFLWNTLDELKGYTLRLMREESLRERMSEAARDRARNFSSENFLQNFRRLHEPFLSTLLPV